MKVNKVKSGIILSDSAQSYSLLVFLCAINIKSRVRDEVAFLLECFFSSVLIFPNVETGHVELVVQTEKVPADLPQEMAKTFKQTSVCSVCIKNTCLNRHNCSLNKSQVTVNLPVSLLTVCPGRRNDSEDLKNIFLYLTGKCQPSFAPSTYNKMLLTVVAYKFKV